MNGKQQGFGGYWGEYGGFFPHRSIVIAQSSWQFFSFPAEMINFFVASGVPIGAGRANTPPSLSQTGASDE